MGLADIADGVTVTTRQEERGVATVDDTDTALAERLEPFADDLPCQPETAARVAEAYTSGSSVGGAAAVAETVPVTAAKTLHLLGTPGMTPLSPLGREVVDDYLAGVVTRSDAIRIAGASEAEFALAVYVATTDPLPGARRIVSAAVAGSTDTPDTRSVLGESLDTPDTLR